jgi:hypothetical protein
MVANCKFGYVLPFRSMFIVAWPRNIIASLSNRENVLCLFRDITVTYGKLALMCSDKILVSFDEMKSLRDLGFISAFDGVDGNDGTVVLCH